MTILAKAVLFFMLVRLSVRDCEDSVDSFRATKI